MGGLRFCRQQQHLWVDLLDAVARYAGLGLLQPHLSAFMPLMIQDDLDDVYAIVSDARLGRAASQPATKQDQQRLLHLAPATSPSRGRSWAWTTPTDKCLQPWSPTSHRRASMH